MSVENRQKGRLAVRDNHETHLVPEYVLRGHTAQINTLSFSKSCDLLFSGDSDGHVAVWSLESFRPVVFAKAHQGSVLTVVELDADKYLSHGRDNKIHVYSLPSETLPVCSTLPSSTSPTRITPLYTIETNALGYCKCSLLQLSDCQALVAVPSTLRDELVDIFHLPSGKRVHRSVGKDAFEAKTGTVMALSLFLHSANDLRVLASYEDGRVAVFCLKKEERAWSKPLLQENEGWSKVFESRHHKEPTMGVALDAHAKRAWSVAADHLVVRYELDKEVEHNSRAYKTAYPGRAGLAIRDDDRILAIAGWDGSIRVHSVATFRPLAVLEYHRESVFTVAFASVNESKDGQHKKAMLQEGSEHDRVVRPRRRAWLAAAGKDERISLWELYPPSHL
ncbi:MAG: ASTRA complex subunit [Cyphobasidiales sp. Tagirdzhanova-0007]|nr:MAG: ASTRA complex subunit [Cyphobasidiales sp. Tagirdzhanova-0007]